MTLSTQQAVLRCSGLIVTCGLLGSPVVAQPSKGRQPSGQEERSRSPRRSRSGSTSVRDIPLAKLPPIEKFAESPSGRFLVDFEFVRTGHPYLGTNANRPHTGCHVYFNPPDKTADQGDPMTYPPIYAVADGYVARIDGYFRLRPIVTAGRTVTNVRYGVTLAIAQRGGSAVNFHYSIEPMIDPGDEQFYLPFIKVKPGQRVMQGDVIAHMYLPPSRENENSHIHFNLLHARQFQAPAIFDRPVVDRFHARWGWRGRDGDDPIPACMGFLLSAPENPFGTGAKPML